MNADDKPLDSGSLLKKAKSGAASLWKLALIGVLMALLLIPMDMIRTLIAEREGNRSEAEREVKRKWGGSQQVAGPILTVPYRMLTVKGDGTKEHSLGYLHFLPEVLNVEGTLDPEIRHRGIFEVALYKADLNFSGTFLQPDFSAGKISPENILWDEAFATLFVPELRSLADEIFLEWQDHKLAFAGDNFKGSPISGGLSVRVGLDPIGAGGKGYRFNVHTRLNGSEVMSFLPMGKDTHVNIASTWGTPSFTGAFLPRENQVDKNGFRAKWITSHLSRTFPQSWKDWEVTSNEWDNYAFGVELQMPVDQYQQATRCAKYAILFILLTFLVFFIFENFDRSRIHPLQYLLVGFALCLFYFLLLALSEHIPFQYAYLSAATATVGLITGYASAILSTRKQAWGLGAMLVALYGYLYSLLQMEDFALLMGAVGLFLILSAVMFLTRKINWYGTPNFEAVSL